jgi:hypothetical protein
VGDGRRVRALALEGNITMQWNDFVSRLTHSANRLREAYVLVWLKNLATSKYTASRGYN